ncbi:MULTISPECIES: UxaA family hydrolase [Collinsella]|uniref:UxaA family hydrolase n=1 Tax=Collinsella ihumii TaxID=1720204 RepID=A0ABT7XDP3_9ACTN|nr:MULTISPECIES: UxaA family hydrolase [Collinsella]MBM6777142.1 UxaA family hydrolase [Collinsella tanakaei]MCF6413176.1 UxaA family hydrolase [Collinsella tanakaei]MDN0063535.1 UxaA family hydrolase [Collinsella ihumii]OUO61701.1 hypothetical protein B5F74_03490 [Collinsella sp. An271]
MDKRALRMAASDDVATVIDAVSAGEKVCVRTKSGEVACMLTAREDIPRFHKICLIERDAGDTVTKYGQIIGRVTSPIGRGSYVHIHNIESIKTGVGA